MAKNKLILTTSILLISVVIFFFPKNKPPETEESTTAVEEVQETYEAWCDNDNEAQKFEKPIPIEWTARFDGCLVSCQGAAFTKTVDDGKYPRFAGYYPDTKGGYVIDDFNPIPEKYQEKGLILKVSGNWIGIEDDHSQTVFAGKCVPIVDIKEIEVVE